MLNGVVTKCGYNGYKRTPLPPGKNCLLSLSYVQCPAVLLIKVTSFVYMHYVCTVGSYM